MPPESRSLPWWFTALPGVGGAVVLVAIGVAPFLQALAALVLVFLPTYLLAWQLLYRRFGSAAAFTIAGGLSIGSVAVAGLVLNLLPWGLQAATWLAYVVVLLGLAFVVSRGQKRWRLKLTVVRHEVVLGGIGAVLMVSALILARAFAGDPVESFTQLSVSPGGSASSLSINLRVVNQEQRATGYRLELWRNGAWIKSWPDIQLATGQAWGDTLIVDAGRFEARLYRRERPGALYRHVTLQLLGPER